MTFVVDSSALLALAYGEDGSDVVHDRLGESVMSSVNAAEVASKLLERETPPEAFETVWSLVADLSRAFTLTQARIAGDLRRETAGIGLSLGDRACLALAKDLGATALTADRVWASVDLGITVEVIR